MKKTITITYGQSVFWFSQTLIAALLFGIFTMPIASAQGKTPPTTRAKFLSEGSITLGDKILNYQAVAEETLVPAKHGLPAARYFSFSYVQTDTPQKGRPITFLFNGGPGSASHWLHLGGMGPQRTVIDFKSQSPYATTDNSDSLLDVSDLVFIDPIGTGFSRVKPPTSNNSTNTIAAAQPPAAQDFWGVVEDAKSITDFILTWLRQNERLDSPIFFVGESYGTLRATLIADELEREHQLSVKGLILLSAAQNYRNIRTPDGSVMGYVSYLPTYSATAWHHKKAGKNHTELEPFIEEARHFAIHDYASALINGNRLSDIEQSKLADKISLYSGLHPTYILTTTFELTLLYISSGFSRSLEKRSAV